jgi:phosphoenolpyruvate carboxykinase (GTP)
MAQKKLGERNTSNPALIRWVEETAELCRPDRIFWCDGSEEERRGLIEEALKLGVLIRLNQEKLPGCYYHRSHSNDVARVEKVTYICTEHEEDAGPTNNWVSPREIQPKLTELMRGSMRGRTLYVIPYLMGPAGSPLSKIGMELTDSIYVVLSLGIMTRMGRVALEELGAGADFNRGLHSKLDLDPERRYVCHFPEENLIWSVGSAYGGNALLSKKCFALRIASWIARREKWFAEHMLLLGVESPEGEKTYVAAAFPSGCGKTNMAMLIPPARYKGWKIWTVGDDITWMKPGADGRLYAINPEAGYFGIVPGTNRRTNPNAAEMISRDTLYTNVALLPDGDVWWEGKNGDPPRECLDWKGAKWTPESGVKAAHPNSRFTTPMRNNPAYAPEAEDPRGVPVSAIIFGGRRPTTLPLVFEAYNWAHGVYAGAIMGSETTAAASGETGQLRRDPMAMLPFCGYHMGDYFRHWLEMESRLSDPPKFYHVNWFRTDQQGNFLWPGFGENMRVLKWIVDRCRGRVGAQDTALGCMPRNEDFDWEGLTNFGREQFENVQRIDPEEWERELRAQEDFLRKLERKMPEQLWRQRDELRARLHQH